MSKQSLIALPRDLYTVPVSWTKRDVLLFANSIGCTLNEPWYLYEGDPLFTAFPTYPINLSFKHTHEDTIGFDSHFNHFINVAIDGVPTFDSRRVVDGGRTISIFKQIPVTSEGRTFKLRTTLLDVGDKGVVGTTISLQHEVYEDGDEHVYAKMTETAFYLGQGGWGGPKGRSLQKFHPPVEREPTARLTHHVSQTAHLLYRLNSDYNPLHAIPEPGEMAGFGGVIMHGLYTWNVTCHHLLAAFAGGQASKLKRYAGQFVKPVRPGDTLHIEAWVMDSVESNDPAGQEVRFLTRVNDEGVCLIGKAIMELVLLSAKNKL